MYFAIKVGSITNAQRALKALRSKGYKPILNRMENPQPSDGCGYVIKLFADDENNVMHILNSSRITVFGVEAL